MKENLKPCQHCGGTASFAESVRNTDFGEENILVIHCDNIICMSQMSCPKYLFTKEELINNWNKRV